LRQISRPSRPQPAAAAPPLAWLARIPWLLAGGFAVACVVLVWQNSQQTQTLRQQAGQIQTLSALASQLQSATNSLAQSILALQETNRLASLRIAMLNSQLAAAPSAIGVTLWDEHGQQGEFVAQNLKPLSNGRDYQLWVIDPNYSTPVSAGVFQVSAQGVGRVSFKADRTIRVAGKFAVTEEPKGGQATPSLDHLVLMGG
jgi:anti-sigma-K factor RskA